MTESCFVETPTYHLESRKFLRNKQYLLAPRKRDGDDVRDGLGLARARRPDDHHVLAVQSIYESAMLRRVCIVDKRQFTFRVIVNIIVLGK